VGCSDLADWYLAHHLPVIDIGSRDWERARDAVLPPGYEPSVCLRRLAKAGRVRRLTRGVYQVIDPVRETPPIAIASALFADVRHYVTTDAALLFHGAIDQPLTDIVVVAEGARRPVQVGRLVVRRVTLNPQVLEAADAYETTAEGFRIVVASREQAVVDALAEPMWMTHRSLLPEVLDALDDKGLDQTAKGALARSSAAGQRLGFLLDEMGREPPTDLRTLKPRSTVQLDPSRRGKVFSIRWRPYA
jgi:predicted transcriptional regulator of viral defense system